MILDKYYLNGVAIFVRKHEKEYEIRLFKDKKNGHVLKMPITKGIGTVLDMAYAEILITLNDNTLFEIEHERWYDHQGTIPEHLLKD